VADEVLYEQRGAIALITMNRLDAANAQNKAMSYALDDAFKRFAADDDASVAILRAGGKHFSAGHDITGDRVDHNTHYPPVTMWWDHVGKEYAESTMAYEEEMYLGMARRWRELPKPTIAAVQGACIGGGLALAWACDLIIASDDAFFSDPVVVMGCPGIEFFCHPWVMGPRRAKEFLFTGERMPASRAYEVGMINRVVPRADLDSAAMELAERIAQRPRFGLAMTKKAVNVAEDEMGMRNGIEHAFALHQLTHAHNTNVCGYPVLVQSPEGMKEKAAN
jgi:enoyl-CoA hydratase